MKRSGRVRCAIELQTGIAERNAGVPDVLFAIARLGAVSVPLNIRHTLTENSHIIKDCEAKVVVHEFDLADRVPAPGAPFSIPSALKPPAASPTRSSSSA